MIVESRIKLKTDTCASFIDFSKVYDRIDRSLLWHKLSRIGIDGKMLRSLKSLYVLFCIVLYCIMRPYTNGPI